MSNSDRKHVVSSSFAGLTAAFELKKEMGTGHEIVLLDPRPGFRVHSVADLADARGDQRQTATGGRDHAAARPAREEVPV